MGEYSLTPRIDPEKFWQMVASLVFIVINAVFGYFGRLLTVLLGMKLEIEKHDRDHPKRVLLRILSCGLCAMEESAYFFEYGLIYERHGGIAFFVVMVLQNVLTYKTYDVNGGFQNPLVVMREIYKENLKILHGIIIFGAQLVAGWLSYRFAMAIWGLGVSDEHKMKSKEDIETCSQIVDDSVRFYLVTAVVIEGVASSIDTLLDILNPDEVSRPLVYMSQYTGWHFIIMAIIIVQGTPTTGGFFNPAMALGHIYGCSGLASLEFFLIYFISPIMCTLCTIVAIQKIVRSTRTKRTRLLKLFVSKINRKFNPFYKKEEHYQSLEQMELNQLEEVQGEGKKMET